MTTETSHTNAADVSADDYVVVGLATCFIKQDGKLYPVKLLEPIPSAALEAIVKGIPTSYEMALATTFGAVLDGEIPRLPAEFPKETQFCDDLSERLRATARSYSSRPIAQSHIARGQVKTDFNYSIERKRTLNSERIVNSEDNVKQHAYTHKVL
jgi:hypothetical protein